MENRTDLPQAEQEEILRLKKARRNRSELIDWLDTIVVSILVVVLLFTFVFRMVGIDGTSMEDTLLDGERVLISDVLYTPKRGDIVVISRDYIKKADGSSPEPIIKRVIATEGQEVFVDYENDRVLVDGVVLEEPYIKGFNAQNGFSENPHVVKKGCVFVMGDHRTVSHDSRATDIGDVDVRYILGRAFVRVYPFSKFEVLNYEP